MSLRTQLVKSLLLMSGALMAACALPTGATAAQIFINSTGSDSATGTRETPYKTIMRGVTHLQPGDTLAICAGEYKEAITITAKGAEDKPILIVAQEGALIEADALDAVTISQSSYLTVQGLVIARAEKAGVVISGSDHITITGCMLVDNGTGVRVSTSDYVGVEKCDIGGSKGNAVLISSTDHPKVLDCKIHDNGMSAVYLDGNLNEGGDGMITGADVSRNIITGNGGKGGAGICMDGVEKSTLERNVVDRNLAGGIVLFRSNSTRGGTGNKLIGNMVRFEKGGGLFGVKLLDGSYKTTVIDSIIAVDRGPSMEVDEPSAKGFKAGHNFYATPGKAATFTWKGQTMDLRGWQTATGQDEDSHTASVPVDYGPAPGAPSGK